MALDILLIDLTVKDSRRRSTFALTPLTSLECLVIQLGTSTGDVVYTFSNTFVDDLMADLLKIFLYMTVIVVLFLSLIHI